MWKGYSVGMSAFEQKMYDGLLPDKEIKGHQGYYPVCNAQEWDELPLPYKVMEWSPVKDYRDKGQLKAVEAVIFDVTYMEPYKIRAKVSVHPQEVQKILFCLHKDTQCHLYSVCGIELDGGTQLGAKWLQDSISGAFAIVSGGQLVGQQGGFRGLIPERVQRLEDGTFAYGWNMQNLTKRSHYEILNPFRDIGRDRKAEVVQKTQDSVNMILDYLKKEQAACGERNPEENIGAIFAYEKAIQAVRGCFADFLGNSGKENKDRTALDEQIRSAEGQKKESVVKVEDRDFGVRE